MLPMEHSAILVTCIKRLLVLKTNFGLPFEEIKSATMYIFRKDFFLFKSLVKAELSSVLTINLFTIAENCMEK